MSDTMLLEYLKVIAGSWPIAAMVIGLAAAFVIRRTFSQSLQNDDTIRSLRAEQARHVTNIRHTSGSGEG